MVMVMATSDHAVASELLWCEGVMLGSDELGKCHEEIEEIELNQENHLREDTNGVAVVSK